VHFNAATKKEEKNQRRVFVSFSQLSAVSSQHHHQSMYKK
jgi:hypothetical protein